MATVEAKVPDIGNYKDVPVIELLVKVGDRVKADQGLVALESDKAIIEVPAPVAGVVREILVKRGDSLSEGKLVALIDTDAAAAAPRPAPAPALAPSPVPSPAPVSVALSIEALQQGSALSGTNAGFVEELYESWLADPASVGERWRRYFDDLGTRTDRPHSPVIERIGELAPGVRPHASPAIRQQLLDLLNVQSGLWRLARASLPNAEGEQSATLSLLDRCNMDVLWRYSEARLLPCIAVLGPFNAGKTTLINQLIGENLLLTSIKPTTSVATVLRHIDDRPADWPTAPACALRKNASLRSLNPADILQSFETADLGRVTTYGENQDWDAIVIWLSAPILKGISLVDLPGIGLPKEIQDGQLLTAAELEAQARVIEQVDGYLLLSNMQGPAFGDVATQTLLHLIATRGVRPVDRSCSNILLVGTNADPTRQELKDESYAIGLIREIITMQYQRLDANSQGILPVEALNERIILFFAPDQTQRSELEALVLRAEQTLHGSDVSPTARERLKVITDSLLRERGRTHDLEKQINNSLGLKSSVCIPKVVDRVRLYAELLVSELVARETLLSRINIIENNWPSPVEDSEILNLLDCFKDQFYHQQHRRWTQDDLYDLYSKLFDSLSSRIIDLSGVKDFNLKLANWKINDPAFSKILKASSPKKSGEDWHWFELHGISNDKFFRKEILQRCTDYQFEIKSRVDFLKAVLDLVGFEKNKNFSQISLLALQQWILASSTISIPDVVPNQESHEENER